MALHIDRKGRLVIRWQPNAREMRESRQRQRRNGLLTEMMRLSALREKRFRELAEITMKIEALRRRIAKGGRKAYRI